MALLLGIDTGGTFTDAALLETRGDGSDSTPQVIAKTKALTTRHDLSIGIYEAATNVLRASGRAGSEIGLVSLSTTLATNALVEGQGGRVGLIAIGFELNDLNKAGLADALGDDPVILIDGGHTTHGQEAKPLDLARLEQELETIAPTVSGFAVAGYFAVRNPAHEKAVRDLVMQRTGKAVTCSHELSARLNGPKRALTTVLNARLVPMITRLINATRDSLARNQIECPVMVVRGDGALVSADFAARRPIETILSGPAASLVGARHLTGLDNAYVNDIGGTTSDIALLQDGRPKLDPDGAMVGGYRTMVEAVAMHTFGLGGDSEVSLGGAALKPVLDLGPRRRVPVSLIAKDYGDKVHKALDAQLKSTLMNRTDGQFAMLSGTGLDAGLPRADARLLAKLTAEPQPLGNLLSGRSEEAVLNRLVGRGLVLVSALTPSDAMHALGHLDLWDRDAALKALALFARRRDGGGNALHGDPLDLAHAIVRRVERRSADVVLQTAFEIDGRKGSELIALPLIEDVLDAREQALDESDAGVTSQTVCVDISLDRPLIGLGASAHQYHGAAAQLLGVEAHIPNHADVANAIGAVVGQIVVRSEVTITQPAEGRFQITGLDQPFASEETAFAAAEALLRERIEKQARAAGAVEFEISVAREEKRAEIESRSMLVEATLIATASGRPPIAD